MRTNKSVGKPEAILIAVIMAALTALTWNYLLRALTVHQELRYIPSSASAFVIFSSARSLWEATAPHVEHLFRDSEPDQTDDVGGEANSASQTSSPVRKAAEELSSVLKEKEIDLPISALPSQSVLRQKAKEFVSFLKDNNLPLSSPADLVNLGIDPERVIILALNFGNPILILPTIDAVLFQKEIERRSESTSITASSIRTATGDYPVQKISDIYLTVPEPNITLLSPTESGLRSALADPEQNLRRLRDNDALQNGFNALVPYYPFQQGAWIRANVQFSEGAGILLGGVNFVISIEPTSVRLGAQARVKTGEAWLLHALVEEKQCAGDSVMNIPESIAASLVLGDSHLTYLLNVFNHYVPTRIRGLVTLPIKDILEEAASLESPCEMAMFYMGLRGITPEAALRIRMSEEEANKIVFNLQKISRVARDRRIIEQASTTYIHDIDGREAPSNDLTIPKESIRSNDVISNIKDPLTLLASGYLTQDNSSLWARYKLTSEGLKDPEFSQSDFAGNEYSFIERGLQFKYILPPMTDDDFRFVAEDTDLDRISKDDLRRDHYRTCSTYAKGFLFIGSDVYALRKLLENEIDRNEKRRARRLVHDSGTKTKISIELNLRQLLKDGLLYPDKQVHLWIREYLGELAYYRTSFFKVGVTDQENELILNLVLEK